MLYNDREWNSSRFDSQVEKARNFLKNIKFEGDYKNLLIIEVKHKENSGVQNSRLRKILRSMRKQNQEINLRSQNPINPLDSI